MAQIGSPGDISPPSHTTAMTPARKDGFGISASNRLFNPYLKRSMRMQGVRRPVSRIFAEVPMRSSVLRGNVSRSSPAVVMFSPKSPGPTSKPAFRNVSNNSLGMRWTCRRFGARGFRRARYRCRTNWPLWASPSTPCPIVTMMESREVLLNRCLASIATATTDPRRTGNSLSLGRSISSSLHCWSIASFLHEVPAQALVHKGRVRKFVPFAG